MNRDGVVMLQLHHDMCQHPVRSAVINLILRKAMHMFPTKYVNTSDLVSTNFIHVSLHTAMI